MQLLINLPDRVQQLAFNRSRWNELLSDRVLANLPFKIETNYSGQILMTPPPSGEHCRRQTRILLLLATLLDGEPLAECPISTIDGVRAADVGWYSGERFAEVRGQIAFEQAPEICVEVISPSNTDAETQHKRSLYFEAGAEEVWQCNDNGLMEYYFPEPSNHPPSHPQINSKRCPEFPASV